MPETASRHIYVGHQLTEDMTGDTQTVFLVHADGEMCFAWLTKCHDEGKWDAFLHDPYNESSRIVHCGGSYEACLMLLASRVFNVQANFKVFYSDTKMPTQ